MKFMECSQNALHSCMALCLQSYLINARNYHCCIITEMSTVLKTSSVQMKYLVPNVGVQDALQDEQ